MEKSDKLFVVDGDGGCLAGEIAADIPRMPVESLDVNSEELSDKIALLNMGGKTLQHVLSALFRQKRAFALFSIASLDAGELAHLVATARKRKSHAWLLGGYRLLPVVAAVKEVIAGGCLGEMEKIGVSFIGEPDGGEWFLARDTALWLAKDARGKDIGVDATVENAAAERKLVVHCAGKAGSLAGMYDWNTMRGSLDAHINGHDRKRYFGAADTLEMELALLEALGGEMREVPGVILLTELQNAEKTSK